MVSVIKFGVMRPFSVYGRALVRGLSLGFRHPSQDVTGFLATRKEEPISNKVIDIVV